MYGAVSYDRIQVENMSSKCKRLVHEITYQEQLSYNCIVDQKLWVRVHGPLAVVHKNADESCEAILSNDGARNLAAKIQGEYKVSTSFEKH